MTQACSLPEIRRALLSALYEVYEELTAEYVFACARECSACCTHNVLATTVEVDLVMDHIARLNRPDLAKRILRGTPGRRMKPQVTINELADYCLHREEPPEPVNDFDAGTCPLRDGDGCPIYRARPFACRSLWSKEKCAADGEALPGSVLVSLNGVFEQLIEDLDVGGLSGNMIDLFACLSDPSCRSDYLNGRPLEPTDDLLANRPNPGFLVPPAHRSAVIGALQMLDKREIRGMPFRQAAEFIRTSLEELAPTAKLNMDRSPQCNSCS